MRQKRKREQGARNLARRGKFFCLLASVPIEFDSKRSQASIREARVLGHCAGARGF